MTPELFVENIASLSFRGVFNPYRDVCPIHDTEESPDMRRKNLLGFLRTALEIGADTIWMGRDLGFRGGRRTGLPLTDEGHLEEFAKRFPGSQPQKATHTDAVLERTATEIWSKISALHRAPFLWNVFPFHPHEDSNPLTNRRFKAKELNNVNHLNQALIDMLGAKKVIAIGRDAQSYAKKLGAEIVCVRHPSYGGTTEFREGIARLYPELKNGENLSLGLI